MPKSQNGWPANEDAVTTSIVVPGGKLRVATKVAPIFQFIAERFHQHIEQLEWPGNWGYAERPIRGSTVTLSNHASGTAIDLNAPKHPLGVRNTFTQEERKRIRLLILDPLHDIVRWGGDYKNRPDEMHFEINVEPDDSRINRVLKELAGKEDELTMAQVDDILKAIALLNTKLNAVIVDDGKDDSLMTARWRQSQNSLDTANAKIRELDAELDEVLKKL